MVKLLHTADWQIGRVYSAFEPDDASAIAQARFEAVEKLATTAAEHQVDAVLVAGDVFDLQTVSDKTIRRLFQATERFKGPWVMIPGNHDAALAESVWSRAKRLGAVPDHIVCALSAEPVEIHPGLVVLPAPLTQRHTASDLTEWFEHASTREGAVRVGIAHGSVQGVLIEDLDSPNPIAAGRAHSARLDYLALGDWHGTKQIDERTWYAGTPESDRFKGNFSGQALLVQIERPGALPQVQPLQIGKYRWQQHTPRLLSQSDVDQLIAWLQALSPSDVVQVTGSGACDLACHRQILDALEQAKARTRALLWDGSELRLEPTDEDIARLKADGFVGEALTELRQQQSVESPATAEAAERDQVARDALLHLARILDAQSQGAAA